jgi:hypothetical protein
MSRYPLRMTQRGHGDLVANNELEERTWVQSGWEAALTEPATYSVYPIMLYGPDGSDLPDLIVKSETEAKEAAGRGYLLPSDDEIEDAEEGFNGQFATADDTYDPGEYPKMLYHPEHRPAVPQSFKWSTEANGLPKVGGVMGAIPEAFPPITVHSLADERTARERGWTIGAATPARKLSGAARRKLARQAAGQGREIEVDQ